MSRPTPDTYLEQTYIRQRGVGTPQSVQWLDYGMDGLGSMFNKSCLSSNVYTISRKIGERKKESKKKKKRNTVRQKGGRKEYTICLLIIIQYVSCRFVIDLRLYSVYCIFMELKISLSFQIKRHTD
jgi:hypothetical protein